MFGYAKWIWHLINHFSAFIERLIEFTLLHSQGVPLHRLFPGVGDKPLQMKCIFTPKMKGCWLFIQVRQIQLCSFDQNRQATGVSRHANPWLIKSMRSAGVSKHPSHPICQADPFHLHVFKLFFSPQENVTYIFYVIAMTDWDRHNMSSRLCEHMWEANRVEWPNRLGSLKSQGWNGQSCESRCVDVNYWAEMRWIAARDKFVGKCAQYFICRLKLPLQTWGCFSSFLLNCTDPWVSWYVWPIKQFHM